jgi:hypothetical protein
MNILRRLVKTALLIIALATPALSQEKLKGSAIQGSSNGAMSGRVTIEGKPAPGLRITLSFVGRTPSPSHGDLSREAFTDQSGKFSISGLPAGTFALGVASSAYVLQDTERTGSNGKTIILHEDEELKDLDLQLSRGGVITGRITDADGRVLIGARPSLEILDAKGQKRPVVLTNQSGETDDRGIYRLFGLPAGRYLVSLGGGLMRERQVAGLGSSHGFHPKTYYPGVPDDSQATIVEVEAGGERANIDIARIRRVEAHTISGRVIDAESGSPVKNVELAYSDMARAYVSRLGSGYRTDSNGEFRIENVRPGRYVCFALLDPNNESYSETVPIEIIDNDVERLQIVVRRGASVSGVAVVEGTDDPAVLAQLSRVTVSALQMNDSGTLLRSKTNITQDGTFKLTGVPPGKVSLLVGSNSLKTFSLQRVELNGIEQPFGFLQVADGEATTGIRLILSYGQGSIRGQIRLQGGTLPDGARIMVNVGKAGAPGRSFGYAQVDGSGRFVITNIQPGNYELVVRTAPPIRSATRQPVTVTGGKVTEALVVLDLTHGK